MRKAAMLIVTGCLLFAMAGHAEEKAGIQIRGVEESPGVLHLVPWRLPEDRIQDEPPVDNARFEGILEPVDDRVHRQHMRYRQNPGELIQKLSEKD